MASHSTNVSDAMAWSGSPAGGSLMSAIARHSQCGWIWLWLAGLARSCTTPMSSLTAPNMRHYDDSLTLMSAELIPRLEGGIRAVLDEAASL